jgi:ribosomal-protein-serine acetyltransferase
LTLDVEIRGDRLLLRSPRRRDLDALDLAIRETLPELVRWLPWAHPAHSRADTRAYLRDARQAWERRAALELVVEDAKSEELLGIVSAHRIDWTRRCAGIGYWVRRTAWGKSVATEAAGALVDFCFRRLELHRLEALVAPGNPASQHVVEKLGFQREGIAREFEFIDGRWLDHIQYGLLAWERVGRPGGPS